MARIGRSFPTHPLLGRPARQGPTASLTATAALAAAGAKSAGHVCSITTAATLTAAGGKATTGVAAITATAVLASGGRKQTGIGSVPRPRLRWQLIIGPASGGHQLAITEAKSRRLTFRLTEPHDVAFSIDGRHPQADDIDELATDIHVLWTSSGGDTRILYRGRAGTSGDTLDPNAHTVEVTALDYRALLHRRRLYSSSTLVYTGQDQALLAWNLIQQTQGQPGGDLGISRGLGQTTGVTRDRTYEPGDSIGERVQELAQVMDGFDWEISPASASALHLDVFYPQRGGDRGVVLEYGGLVRAVRREVTSADYGNALRYTGTSDPLPLAAQELEAADVASAPQGRWDLVFGDDGLTTQEALDDRAIWQLSQSQVVRPTYTLTLRAGSWDGPDHLWLGDTVRVVVMSGRLAVNTVLRVHEIAVSLGDSGDEVVEVTVGGPRQSFKTRPTITDRRLTNLERR